MSLKYYKCFAIHNNENYSTDADSLPNEFLVFSFDPDISDNEEEVAGEENADSLGMGLRALYHFELYLSGTRDEDSGSETVTIRL